MKFTLQITFVLFVGVFSTGCNPLKNSTPNTTQASVSSPSNNKDEALKPKLVGVWKLSQKEGKDVGKNENFVIEFTKDRYKWGNLSNFPYELKNGAIYIDSSPGNEKEEWTIESLTDTELVVKKWGMIRIVKETHKFTRQ